MKIAIRIGIVLLGVCIVSVAVWAMTRSRVPFTRNAPTTVQSSSSTVTYQPQVSKDLCKSLATQNLSENPVLPLTCKWSIGKNVSAEFSFDSEGGLTVLDGKTLLFKVDSQHPNQWGDWEDVDLRSFESTQLERDSFDLRDVNFDGYNDIGIEVSASAYNFEYRYYTYDPVAGIYNHTPVLDVWNPTFYPNDRTVVSHLKSRGLDDTYEEQTYYYENPSYTVIRTESQSLNEDGTYERVVNERKNGKMVEVERKSFPANDVLGS